MLNRSVRTTARHLVLACSLLASCLGVTGSQAREASPAATAMNVPFLDAPVEI